MKSEEKQICEFGGSLQPVLSLSKERVREVEWKQKEVLRPKFKVSNSKIEKSKIFNNKYSIQDP